MSGNVHFYEPEEKQYPFTIFFFSQETGEEVHRIFVPEPGAVVVPSLKHLGPTKVRIEWGDGVVTEAE